MRKTLLLAVIFFMLAPVWARPSFAACPGVSACIYNKGCPAGSTLVSPGQSIQAAINAAPCTGAILCVAPGTYTGLINFKGKPITLISSAGPAVTILDGGAGGSVVTFASAEGKDSIVDGFTIRNGKAPYGAGVYINGASPTIRNSIVAKNAATGKGGKGGGVGVLGAQAGPAITCTRIMGNTATISGGGLMSVSSANPYLRSDDFEGNSARYGGAIGVASSGRLDLGWTELFSNQASSDGGGIYAGAPYGNVLVRQVRLRNNTAGVQGGGMWVRAGLAEILNSTFLGNRALEGGGIAAGDGGMVDVASTLFVGNVTTNSLSATLVDAQGSNTSVVNHYNGFFGNTGTNYKNTYGDKALLIPGSDPLGSSCCPPAGSPALNAGIPDTFFNDPDGSRNDMGACGGPALSTYGPMQ